MKSLAYELICPQSYSTHDANMLFKQGASYYGSAHEYTLRTLSSHACRVRTLSSS